MNRKEFQLGDGSTSTFSSPASIESMSIDKIMKMVEELKKIPEPSGKWILISDTGKIYIDKPEELLLVLAPYHPLLKPLDSTEKGILK